MNKTPRNDDGFCNLEGPIIKKVCEINSEINDLIKTITALEVYLKPVLSVVNKTQGGEPEQSKPANTSHLFLQLESIASSIVSARNLVAEIQERLEL